MTNPKQIHGDTKIPLHLVPASASVELAIAMAEGSKKYGSFNWVEEPVEYMTYVGAIYRHMLEALAGVERDPSSGAHPLGHVMACCAILIDAEAQESLIDNRPSVPCSVIERMEEYRRRFDPEIKKKTPAQNPSLPIID